MSTSVRADVAATFAPPTSFAVGAGSRATALADFNRDGQLDVVIVGDGGSGTSGVTGIPSVSIRFGRGDGTFGPLTTYRPVGSAAVNVAVGDLNGDGAPDLVVAMINSSSLAVLLNNGDGTFGTSYAAGSGDSAVAIVDWNGDGKQDIIATSYWSSTAFVSLGNGNGTFATPQSYSVGQNPFGLVVADLNHDGVLDLASSDDTTNSITVLLFSNALNVAKRLSLRVGSWPFGIAAVDMNRDGNLDLVTGNTVSNDVSVLYGDGSGNFAPAQNFAAGIGPRHIAIADVNGDDALDIIVADAEGSTLAVLLANSTSFAPAVLLACPTTPYGVAIADLDHDNRADIITGNRTSNDALVYLRRTLCQTPDAYIINSGPLTFCAGGSVTLTANGGGTYLWSTGATSQSITTTQSGSYSVTVTAAGGCSATSAPVVINAAAGAAAPTVTADGPTTFCAGGGVNLTASAADSYLWSTGQRTQAIHVTEAGSYSVTSPANSGLQLIRSYTIPPNNIKTFPMTQQCTETAPGSGVYPQLCAPIHNVTVNTGSTLRIPSLVANTCSSVRFNIYVDGTLRYTTPFLSWEGAPAPFSSLPRNAGPIDLGIVNAGTHIVGFQAEGQISGCNTAGVGAWGATAWIETIETYQAVPAAVVTDRATHRAYISFGYQSEPVYPGVLMVWDTATDQPITTIDLGAQAGRAALNAVTHKVYIASASAGVTIVDTVTNTVTAHINVGGAASGVAVNPLTNRVYVAVNGYKLVVLDGNTDTVLQTITLSVQDPGEVVVNANLNRIYITENNGTFPLLVVDGATNTEVKKITTVTAVAMAVDEVSNRLFVGTLQGSADINVFDRDEALIHTIPQFGAGAEYVRGIAFDDVRNIIYRPRLNSGEVEAIDGSTYALIKKVATGSDRLYYAGIDPQANKIFMLERDSFEAGRPRLEGRVHILSGGFSCNSTSVPFVVNVNPAPQVNAGVDQTIVEGSSFTLNATTDAAAATVNWGDATPAEPTPIVGGAITATHPYMQNGTFHVAISGTTATGCGGSDDLLLTVTNAAPIVGQIAGPATRIPVNAAANFSASFTDAGKADTHTAAWSWGDTSSSAAIPNESNGSGTVSGVHPYGAAGTFTLTLTVTDGDGGSGTSTFSVVVYNPAPLAVNDTFSTTENQSVSITAPGVLSNDTDPDNRPLTAVLVSSPAHGTAALNANGSFTYTPAADFYGTDSFTYKANDGAYDSPPATVSIVVKPNPRITVNDVVVTEGDAGTVGMTFVVSLSHASTETITVNYATVDGSATAGADYAAATGTATFAPGTTAQAIVVNVLGDTLDEDDETFALNLSGAINAVIADAQGICTIADNDLPPGASVNDISVVEGNSGPTVATFDVTLSAPSAKTVTMNYATADSSATAGQDYVTATGTLTFAPGVVKQTVSVQITGDIDLEQNEQFFVNLTLPLNANATLAKAQGIGTITNDDGQPTINIDNVVLKAPLKGSTEPFEFHVTLSAKSWQTVTVQFFTSDQTAYAGTDYVATSGMVTFSPGTTAQTVTVTVKGTGAKTQKQFLLNLQNPVNAPIAIVNGYQVRGTGVIQP